MSNVTLSHGELNKVFKMYEDYGEENLSDFIRMIWREAYSLGHSDGSAEGHTIGYVKGWNERLEKEPNRPKGYGAS